MITLHDEIIVSRGGKDEVVLRAHRFSKVGFLEFIADLAEDDFKKASEFLRELRLHDIGGIEDRLDEGDISIEEVHRFVARVRRFPAFQSLAEEHLGGALKVKHWVENTTIAENDVTPRSDEEKVEVVIHGMQFLKVLLDDDIIPYNEENRTAEENRITIESKRQEWESLAQLDDSDRRKEPAQDLLQSIDGWEKRGEAVSSPITVEEIKEFRARAQTMIKQKINREEVINLFDDARKTFDASEGTVLQDVNKVLAQLELTVTREQKESLVALVP